MKVKGFKYISIVLMIGGILMSFFAEQTLAAGSTIAFSTSSSRAVRSRLTQKITRLQ